MALIKLQDRLKVYNSLLGRMKLEDKTGLCHHLGILCFNITGRNFSFGELLRHFPEIDKHHPQPHQDGEFWWPRDQQGYAMRRWVCREAIKETERKLLKYKKMHDA